MNNDVFTYRIDSRDIIISVSPNWEQFALDNAWASECSPEKVVGRLLWDFIQDAETRYLYREVFKRVRAGNSIGPIPFRCDSPRERRFLRLLLSPLSEGRIAIASTIVRTEKRSPVPLLEIDTPRSSELIRICSMCKKIATPESGWVDIEDALVQSRPFELAEMPSLTHGICPGCFEVVMAELDNPEPTDNGKD